MKKRNLAMMMTVVLLAATILGGCDVTEGNAPAANTATESTSAVSEASEATTTTGGGTETAGSPTASASTNEVPANAEIIIKFGHNDSELGLLESPYYAYSRVFKNTVENMTGGRIGVQVFPSNQLGDLPSMLEQTVKGTIQMTAGQNTGLAASYLPKIQVLDIPYTFSDLNAALTVLNGEFGQDLSQDLIDAAGIRVLSYLPTAFRNFASNGKQIKSAADISGMKVRVMEIPLHMDMVENMGGIPSVISFAELYSALQTGVVDAQEQAPYTMVMNNLQEVTKYYTLSQHLLNSNMVTMNEDFFQSLSTEDQQVIMTAARAAQRAMIGITTANEPEVYDKLRAAGVEIYQPTDEELQTFREATREGAIEYMISEGVDEAYVRSYLELADQTQEELKNGN